LLKVSKVQIEMADKDGIVCITTIADRKKDFKILLKALNKLPLKNRPIEDDAAKSGNLREMPSYPQRAMSLSEAMQCHIERISLDDADGRICAAIIAPFPPGTPLVCPGEIIRKDMIVYIKYLHSSGISIEGLDQDLGVIIVAGGRNML
jgi:lysine decarboxylase